MTTFQDIEHTWDSIAQEFDSTRTTPWDHVKTFINLLPPDSIVADLGCGNGRHLLPCAQHCKKVIGVDISTNLLSLVRQKLTEHKLHNARLVQGNLVALPFPNHTFDAILSIASLHNIPRRINRVQALQEIRRVLKPTGAACMTVWRRWQDRFFWFFIKDFFKRSHPEYGDIMIPWTKGNQTIQRYYHLYSHQEFKHDLHKAGFTDVTIQPIQLASKKRPDNYFVICTCKQR